MANNFSVQWPEPGLYIIAVSGGVDSVVLLDLLATRGNYQLVVGHIDHAWRQESAKDATFVSGLAEQYGLPLECVRLAPPPATEEAARLQRYAYLHQWQEKHKARAVITAHHYDDVIETSLMNLLGGAGPRGVAEPLGSGIVRPLLQASKREITEYAKAHRLAYRADETNTDTRFRRNYLRHRLIPALTQQDPNFLKTYEQFLGWVRKTEPEADKYFTQEGQTIELSKQVVAALPLPLLASLLHEAAYRLGAPVRDRETVEDAALRLKTAKLKSTHMLSSRLKLAIEPDRVVVTLNAE